MREIQMWKDTPTAPYSLKTFFSCCALLGFPPPGSSGWLEVFGDDVELTESAFKFSWRIKKRKEKKRAKGEDEQNPMKTEDEWTMSPGRTRQEEDRLRDENQQKMWMTKRKQMKPVGRLTLWISNVSVLLIFIFQGAPLLTKLASSEIKALLWRWHSQTLVMWKVSCR